MKRITQVATFVCIILMASCAKEEHLPTSDLQAIENGLATETVFQKNGGMDDPIITTAPSYYPMEVGNHWVYLERTYRHSTGEYSLEHTTTTTIICTEMINGESYFKFEEVKKGNSTFYHLRFNENGEIVNHGGWVSYSLNYEDVLFTQTIMPGLEDYLGDFEYRMVGSTTPLTVPAGTYNTRSYQGISNYVQPNPFGRTHATVQSDYAMGVGVVRGVCDSATGGSTIYKELVSYSLN